MKNAAAARRQLDARFKKVKLDGLFVRPNRGWIRAIRNSLSMSAVQMAARLGVSQPRIHAMEQGEINGALTLESLEKAARALDCTLVYALVPNRPLEEMVRARAEQIAACRLDAVAHTMNLEQQRVNADDLESHRAQLVDDIIHRESRRLWDEK